MVIVACVFSDAVKKWSSGGWGAGHPHDSMAHFAKSAHIRKFKALVRS